MYKLLIADDEPLERSAIRYFIENSHLEIGQILESENGTETVRIAMAEQPEIIILDIKMPGLNGLEAMERIKTVHKNLKVIISTAYNYFDYAVKALQLNAMDFLVKPVKRELLIGVMNKAIDQLDACNSAEKKELQLEEVIHILGKKILGELVLGKIDEETLYYLDAIGVNSDTVGQTFIIQMEREVSGEKSQRIQSILRKDLSEAGYPAIVRINHRNLTLVIFAQNEALMRNLQEIAERILSSIFRDIRLGHTISAGMVFEDISGIEQSYASAYLKVTKETGKLPEVPYERKTHSSTARDQSLPQELQYICSYLQEHYPEKITLDSLAAMVKYSKFYVSRLFRQWFDVTIIDYLIRLRIDKAKELLLGNSYSIK